MDIIRVVALLEAHTVTGPARNVIRFCRLAAREENGPPAVRVSIVTIMRHGAAPAPQGLANDFTRAVRESGTNLDIITERFRFDPDLMAQLAAALRRHSPDIVQTHSVKSHFLMRCTGQHHQYRWIAFHHGYTAEDLKMRLYNCLDRWSLRAAERVVTVCRPFAESLTRRGVKQERIRVLPNSIDEPPRAPESQVRELRQRLGIQQGERVVLCVGRFSREKGQLDLVQAGAHLSRSQPGLAFRVVLLGAGPQRREVERAVEATGLSGKFWFAGQQTDVWPYYAMADLLALPSHSEGSPNVLLEAMATGLPVVATAVGGVPETVENEQSALLVPAADPGALANAMGRLLNDDELAGRLAANARSAVKQRHSASAYCRSLKGVYEEVLGEQPRAAGG